MSLKQHGRKLTGKNQMKVELDLLQERPLSAKMVLYEVLSDMREMYSVNSKATFKDAYNIVLERSRELLKYDKEGYVRDNLEF